MGVNKVFQNGYLRREGTAALEGVAGVAARARSDGLVLLHLGGQGRGYIYI